MQNILMSGWVLSEAVDETRVALNLELFSFAQF